MKRFLVPLVLSAIVPAWLCAQADAGGRKKPSILFTASHHELGAGGYRFLVDPRYKSELEEDGWAVGYAALPALTWEKLKRFNVVVLQQHPDVERFRLNGVFQNACRLINRYVEAGGGVLCFGDLHRGRIYGNLNRMLKPFGVRFHYAVVEETDARKIRELKNYRAVKAFLTDNVAPSPVTEGVRCIWYPRFAQTTATFDTDDNWRVVVRGSATSRSVPLGEDRTAASGLKHAEAPPLVAYRTYGKGRMVIFSSHSSWYTLNPYHFMWDEGFFLREGDARRLLQNIYRWLSEPGRGTFGGFKESEQKQVFDIGPRLKESVRKTVTRAIGGAPRSGIIGVRTTYSGGSHTVDEFCKEAARLGLDYLVFAEDRGKMDAEKWRRLADDCRRNTSADFLALPGVRFLGGQSGNEGVIFNIRKPWAELPWDEPGFDTFIRLGCKNSWLANTAQINPNKNPFPYYNQGAVNAHTLFTYRAADGEMRLADEDWRAFLESNAYGWALAPQTFHEIDDPSQLRAALHTFRTFFHRDGWGKNVVLGRDVLLNTSVSNGPIIKRFALTEPGPWVALDDRPIEISLEVSAEAPLAEVKLCFGGRLLRCFRPGRKSFRTAVRCVTNESRFFYLHVTDAEGRMAFSKALPASRIRYHHFIGGDRMNGYWWPAEACPPEQATAKPSGKWARIIGSLYPRLGWGETIGCVSPSQVSHPIGLETGSPDGGVRQIYVSPRIRAGEITEFVAAAPYRTFPLDSTDCVIVEDKIERDKEHYKQDGRTRKRVKDAKLLAAHVRTIGYRWRSAIILLIESDVRFKQDVEPERGLNWPALVLFKAFCDARTAAYETSLYLSESGKLVENGQVLLPEPTPLPAGGYVALYPHPFGVPAVFAFEKAHFSIYEAFGTPQLCIGDDIEGGRIAKGSLIRRRYLFVLTAGGKADKELFARIHDRYGFDGEPAYEVSVRHGELLEAVYAPRLRACDFYVLCNITKADLPNALGLRVEDLNENWDAGIYDLNEKKLLKHVAVYNGAGYLVLDVGRPRDVFIGNLLVADKPEVRINVLEFGPKGIRAVVHNPAETEIAAVVKPAPGLPGLRAVQKRLKLAPGAEIEIKVPSIDH